MSFEGASVLVTGGSRGIGKAIALRAARDGANVAIVAKTEQPHPKLPGTIYSAAEAIEQLPAPHRTGRADFPHPALRGRSPVGYRRWGAWVGSEA